MKAQDRIEEIARYIAIANAAFFALVAGFIASSLSSSALMASSVTGTLMATGLGFVFSSAGYLLSVAKQFDEHLAISSIRNASWWFIGLAVVCFMIAGVVFTFSVIQSVGYLAHLERQ